MAGNRVDEEAEHCVKRGPSQWENNSSNRKSNQPCNRPGGGWVAGRGWGGHRAGWRREHGPWWREGWSWAWIRGAARHNNQKTHQHIGKPQWEHRGFMERPNDRVLQQNTGAPKSRGMPPSLRAPGQSFASSKECLSPDVLMHKHALCPISQLFSRWPELLHYLLYHWPWGTCAGPTYVNLQLCVLLPALLHTDRALSQPLAFTAACFKTYVSAKMNIFLGHKGHSSRKQFPVYIFNYMGCVPLEIQVCIRNTLGDRGRTDTHLSETELMAVCSSLGGVLAGLFFLLLWILMLKEQSQWKHSF